MGGTGAGPSRPDVPPPFDLAGFPHPPTDASKRELGSFCRIRDGVVAYCWRIQVNGNEISVAPPQHPPRPAREEMARFEDCVCDGGRRWERGPIFQSDFTAVRSPLTFRRAARGRGGCVLDILSAARAAPPHLNQFQPLRGPQQVRYLCKYEVGLTPWSFFFLPPPRVTNLGAGGAACSAKSRHLGPSGKAIKADAARTTEGSSIREPAGRGVGASRFAER